MCTLKTGTAAFYAGKIIGDRPVLHATNSIIICKRFIIWNIKINREMEIRRIIRIGRFKRIRCILIINVGFFTRSYNSICRFFIYFNV